MRVLLVNQFFHPDHSALAQIAGDLAEDLVVAGHQVTVVAARGGTFGGATLPARETWRGVEIVRVRATAFGKRSLVGRIADYLTFYVAAAWRLLRLPRHDVVVATSAPPLVATLGALLGVVKGSAFVYWLQDVYPELAVEFGLLASGALAVRGFEWVSRATLRRAAAVVVLGEVMARRIREKGIPPERVHVIPNWADGRAIVPISRDDNSFRRHHGLQGKTVVLYSGNMGRGHDMATILEAARRLQEVEDLVFAFIGDGAKRAEVEAAGRALRNVRLFPYQPREHLMDSLSAGDVHVVTQDPCTLGLMEPSKLYGVLAAGRPVLFVGPADSETARTVVDEGVGMVVQPGDVEGTTTALLALAARSYALGAKARAAFDREYDRHHRTATFERLLRRLSPG